MIKHLLYIATYKELNKRVQLIEVEHITTKDLLVNSKMFIIASLRNYEVLLLVLGWGILLGRLYEGHSCG